MRVPPHDWVIDDGQSARGSSVSPVLPDEPAPPPATVLSVIHSSAVMAPPLQDAKISTPDPPTAPQSGSDPRPPAAPSPRQILRAARLPGEEANLTQLIRHGVALALAPQRHAAECQPRGSAAAHWQKYGNGAGLRASKMLSDHARR